MKEVVRRHRTTLAVAAYVAATLFLSASPLLLGLPSQALPYLFPVATLALAAAGLWLWHRSHAAMTALAFRDDLTSLSNRRAFNLRAAEFGTEERGGTRSLVLFDVDGLKDFNERCGHQAGDELLSAIGRRMSDLPAPVYRIGGDEFAVLVDRSRGESAIQVLRRLEPFTTDFASCGHFHGVNVSYGFASALPDEGFDDLFRRADDRLRQFKRELYDKGAMPNRRAEPLAEPVPWPDDPTPGKKTIRGKLKLLG
jgi:diguanylate cyclase (GGDEF)-like protein